MEKVISTVGINIKKIRESKGLSAYKLSKLAKVGGATISQIESGERKGLNTSTLIKIANALDVTTEDLTFEEGSNEYIVKDLKEAIMMVLSSEEITLDDEEISLYEKEIIEKYLDKAISVIRIQRSDLK